MKIVMRLINSFDFSMVFYTTIEANGQTKICDLVPKIKEIIDKDNKFRPVRPKFQKYDTFRVYCKAGEPKDMNLCFNEKEGVEISKDSV